MLIDFQLGVKIKKKFCFSVATQDVTRSMTKSWILKQSTRILSLGLVEVSIFLFKKKKKKNLSFSDLLYRHDVYWIFAGNGSQKSQCKA